MKHSVFCNWCNYAITKIQRDQARFDFPCPNCHNVNISKFYSYGSMIHKLNWESRHTLPKVGIRPIPYPYSNSINDRLDKIEADKKDL